MVYPEIWNMYDFAGKHMFVCSFLLKCPWIYFPGLPLWLSSKESACSAGDTDRQVQSLSGEDPLEKGMASHSSIPAWRIPWTEEPSRLQSMGLQESDTT